MMNIKGLSEQLLQATCLLHAFARIFLLLTKPVTSTLSQTTQVKYETTQCQFY